MYGFPFLENGINENEICGGERETDKVHNKNKIKKISRRHDSIVGLFTSKACFSVHVNFPCYRLSSEVSKSANVCSMRCACVLVSKCEGPKMKIGMYLLHAYEVCLCSWPQYIQIFGIVAVTRSIAMKSFTDTRTRTRTATHIPTAL